MISIAVNRPLERAKADAVECARSEGRPYAVVIGYDDYDRLAWQPVPLEEVGQHEEVMFIANPVAEGQ